MEVIPELSMSSFQSSDDPSGPTFAFQPATPSYASLVTSVQAAALDGSTPTFGTGIDETIYSPRPLSRSVTPAPHAGSVSPGALSAGFPDVPDNISDVGSSAGGAASLLAFAQLGAAGAADSTEAAQLSAMSPHILPATSPILSPHVTPAGSHEFALPAMPEPLPGASGPIRNKRGAANSLALDFGGHDLTMSLDFLRDLSPNHAGDATQAQSKRDSEGSESPKEGRVIKMGDHTFTIPLKSPTVAPQLQSSVRITSTGKPSHAKKVPEGHVKRPRNAFILFRSYACTNNLLPASLGITDHRQVSRVVGQLWKGLKPEEKAIWEKKAQEEKEEHRRNNPNYRYRPVFSKKEQPAKKRRRKPTEDEVVEEEERKCEVVARVLLEGRDVSHEELEQEVEQQKIQDQIEGKERGRSRSRSKSVNRQAGQTLDGVVGLSRPSSAPPGQEDEYEDMYGGQHLGVGKRHATRQRRSRTMGSNLPDYEVPQHYGASYPGDGMPDFGHPHYAESDRYVPLPPNIIAPSPRSVSNLSGLFANGSEAPMQAGDLTAGFGGFKTGGLGDHLSLVSPSFSRKFSLGRWEVPYTAGGPMADPGGYGGAPFAPNEVASNSSYGSADHGNYTYDAHMHAGQAYAQEQPAPTYVYLSKEDAQNPEIVNHYLSQGYGVSYDA